MLSEADYQEAVRGDKNMKVKGHERQRSHALILLFQGYSQSQVAEILLVDEDTVRRWVRQYEEQGLGGLRNHEQWGGAHGQRELSPAQVAELKGVLSTEAMAGTKVGSGWTNKAVRALITERWGVKYGKSGVRKLFAHLGWSYQRGRKLYIRRDPVDQARDEEETRAVLAQYARNGQQGIPLASDQSQVYLEGNRSRIWHGESFFIAGLLQWRDGQARGSHCRTARSDYQTGDAVSRASGAIGGTGGAHCGVGIGAGQGAQEVGHLVQATVE